MNNMSRFGFISIALMATFTVAGTARVRSQEKKLKPKQLPAAVQAAFQMAYSTAIIKPANSEVESGKAIYEVQSLDGKIKRDLLYS